MVNFYKQELLLLNKDPLKKNFFNHGYKKNFMAVYFTNLNTTVILFKNNKELVQSKFNSFNLAFIFNTVEDFETQFKKLIDV